VSLALTPQSSGAAPVCVCEKPVARGAARSLRVPPLARAAAIPTDGVLSAVGAMVLECRDDSLNNNGGGGGGVCGDVGGPHLSVSLCCIWEQPAPLAAAPPPPPPPVTVRRPPGRSKRTLADRASWAGFSARGRSHVLMGTQVLPHHIIK